jgi:hypothetical protein
MPDELTPADWNEARKLLSLNSDQLHRLRLDEVRAGANLLRVVSDLCKQRGRAMHKFADAKEAIGAVDQWNGFSKATPRAELCQIDYPRYVPNHWDGTR